MQIEQADVQDALSILTLQRLAYQSEAVSYNDPAIAPLLQTLDEIQVEFETHHFLKVIEEGQIVGSVRAALIDYTCHIGRLIVHPAKQHRGIGTALMKHVEERYPIAERFELFTGSQSKQNIRLYQKLGYTTYKTKDLSVRVTLVYMEKYQCQL